PTSSYGFAGAPPRRRLVAHSLLAGYHVMADGKEGRVQNDEPTLPPRIGNGPDDTTDPNAFSEAPTWPPAGARPLPPRRSDHSPLLWLSLGATGVAVIGLLGVLLLNQLGVFASRGATGSPGPTNPLSSPRCP